MDETKWESMKSDGGQGQETFMKKWIKTVNFLPGMKKCTTQSVPQAENEKYT